MIEIGITKKQHYVSQGILKHFADQQKKIYELFIDKSIVTKKSIVDTMSQNYERRFIRRPLSGRKRRKDYLLMLSDFSYMAALGESSLLLFYAGEFVWTTL